MSERAEADEATRESRANEKNIAKKEQSTSVLRDFRIRVLKGGKHTEPASYKQLDAEAEWSWHRGNGQKEASFLRA